MRSRPLAPSIAMTLALAVLLAPIAPPVAQAADIRVTEAWARPSLPGAPVTAAFMTIANDGANADRVIGVNVEPAIADKAELHNHVLDNGVMRMRPVEAIDLPAHGAARLAPGGLHVMVFGVKAPWRAGDHPRLTLILDKAGPVPVEVTVGAQPLGDHAAH